MRLSPLALISANFFQGTICGSHVLKRNCLHQATPAELERRVATRARLDTLAHQWLSPNLNAYGNRSLRAQPVPRPDRRSKLRQAVESSWHMSESYAAHYKDAVKITGTEEIRTPTGSTGDFFKSLPKSEQKGLSSPLGTLPIRRAEGSALERRVIYLPLSAATS